MSGFAHDSEQRFDSSSGGTAVAGLRRMFTALSSSSGAGSEIGRLPLPERQGKALATVPGGPSWRHRCRVPGPWSVLLPEAVNIGIAAVQVPPATVNNC